MKIVIINGPNLNLLGKREVDIYGGESFDSFFKILQEKYASQEITYFQSNVEGELINEIQRVGFSYDGIILTQAGTRTLQLLLAMPLLPLPHPL